MAINYETHSNVSVVITKELKEQIKEIADKDKRSMSAEIAYILEKYIRENG